MAKWTQPNPWGAGFQNTGAIAPWTGFTQHLVSGGDTAGLHKSTNSGDVWANRDASLSGTSTHAAAIEPHPTQTGRWFALMGNASSGGLWESIDNGDTWTNASSGTANVFGNGALAGNSGASSLLGPNHGEHPRSVGRLITIDATRGYIYVATFKFGVYRGVLGSVSGITSWTRIYSTANTYTRGILYDPAQDMLYFSTFSDPGSSFTTASGHIWRSADPRAVSPTFVAMTGSPVCCSAMLVIADRLYAVAHPITANLADRGLWYIDSAHNVTVSAAWTQIAGVPTGTGERWMSLDGYVASGTTTLWTGSAQDGAHSLCKAVSSGGAWTCTVYPTTIATTINDLAGPNVPTNPWWLFTYKPGLMLGRSIFVASTIRINPSNHNEIFVFGRSGVWRTRNGGTNWYPIVKGIGATVTLTTICDPNKQGSVYVGLGDWSVLTSKDDLASVAQIPPATGSFSYSMCIDESVTPTALFTAASPRQDQSGYTSKVYQNLDPNGATNWVDTGLNVSNEIIVCLAAVYSGATRVLIAGDSGGSLWRRVGGGSWTLVPNTNMSPNGGIALTTSDTQVFARDLTHGGIIYLYDRGTGIWRSTDAGLHWVRIWAHAAGNSSDQSGWIDVHPNTPHVLYVSDSTSVYKITDADTCLEDAATHVTLASAIGAKGPMAVDKVNNKIGLCDITTVAKFWESDLSTINWVNQADSLYLNAAGLPQWLSYDRTGLAHVALSGNGVISMATPPGTAQPPSVTAIPAITGSNIEGSLLSADNGTWSGIPTPNLTRRWQHAYAATSTTHVYDRSAAAGSSVSTELQSHITAAASDLTFTPPNEQFALPLGTQRCGPNSAQGVVRIEYDTSSGINTGANAITLDAVVVMADNVRLEIDSGVCLLDMTASTTGMITTTGKDNWSITRGDPSRNGGKYRIDCSVQGEETAAGYKSRLTHCQDSSNFMVEWVESIQYPYTVQPYANSATAFLPFHPPAGTVTGDGFTKHPRNFIYRYHTNLGSESGWGPNQISGAANGYITGITSQGGTCLRFETDGLGTSTNGLSNILAVGPFYLEHGNRVCTMTPHSAVSDHVVVTGVYGYANFGGVFFGAPSGGFTNSSVTGGCIVGVSTGAENPGTPNGTGNASSSAVEDNASAGVTYSGIGRAGAFTRNTSPMPGGDPNVACTVPITLVAGGVSERRTVAQTYVDILPTQTGATYAIPGSGAAVGDTYEIEVTAQNTQGYAVQNSAATTAVTTSTKPTCTVLPVVTGTVQAGQTLTCSNGTWTGSPTFARQWQASPSGAAGTYANIASETASTYAVPSSGVDGTYVRCNIVGSNVGGPTTASSLGVGPILPLVDPNTAPTLTISGPSDVIILPATPQVTATAADADGISTVTASLNLGTPVAMVATTGDDYFLDLGTLDPGSYTMDVQATDSNVSPLSTTVSASFTVIQPDDSGSGTGGGGELTISTDIVDINLRITQRGLA